MTKNILLEIEGLIETTIGHDDFLTEFYKWLEFNNWYFTGATKVIEQETEPKQDDGTWRGFLD